MRLPHTATLAAAILAVAGCHLHTDLDSVERRDPEAGVDADAHGGSADAADAAVDASPDPADAADADAADAAGDTAPDAADADARPDAPANAAPEVVIAAPASEAGFAAGDAIWIAWDASDADGAVAAAAILLDGEVLHETAGDAAEWVWPQATLGRHEVRVRATDDDGLSAESPPVVITVYRTASFQDGVSPPDYTGTRDASITAITPSTPLGATERLEADQDAATLLRWSLDSLPTEAIVLGARVRLSRHEPLSDEFSMYEMRRDWVELEATWFESSSGTSWEAEGASGGFDRGEVVLGTADEAGTTPIRTTHTEAFVPLVQRWVRHPLTNRGIIITGTNTDGLHMRSREYTQADERPALEIRYTLPLP